MKRHETNPCHQSLNNCIGCPINNHDWANYRKIQHFQLTLLYSVFTDSKDFSISLLDQVFKFSQSNYSTQGQRQLPVSAPFLWLALDSGLCSIFISQPNIPHPLLISSVHAASVSSRIPFLAIDEIHPGICLAQPVAFSDHQQMPWTLLQQRYRSY